ncbi:RidA family protein [Croceivirga thetidis]|uniref:RidA family protein n=1 Tax=Croceivirga thetidis TaxID=2721623 RepID=A0ABX1GN18_9FLAO|nr:RidA family protein [Croceivirga thetidis]NKI31053.1 RidA family protein [Croceivirga thetidis]
MKKLILAGILLSFVGCISYSETSSRTTKTKITKTFIDPGPGYSQAVAVEVNGVKTIHISGQVGTGQNFESQFRDALNNLFKTLEVSGASFKNVVKYNTYIVDYQPAHLDTFRMIRKQLLGDEDMPASTLVGVEALGLPEWGVEIEAIAVVPSK